MSQMAAQEVLGVLVAAILQQQGSMREITVWEMEMEDALRRLTRLIEEEKVMEL